MCLLFTPDINLTDLHSYQQSSRRCASLEKLLALLHPLEDHLTVHCACCPSQSRQWLLEHSPIQKLPQGTRKLSSEIVEIKFTCSVGYRQFWQGLICTAWKNQRHVCTVDSHTASSVAACYTNVYCTRFVSTNESRAWFVGTNPIEVPWKILKMWSFADGPSRRGPSEKYDDL